MKSLGFKITNSNEEWQHYSRYSNLRVIAGNFQVELPLL